MNILGKKFGQIQFTLEKEINRELNFLDLKITRVENKLTSKVYRKPYSF